MLNYQVKIGLVAMRRNTTDRPRGTFLTWYSAEQRGKRFVKYIEENFTNENVSFVDNKGIGHEDLVFDDASAAEVIERFKNEKVDAVMIINCNFGNEEAAADIAKALDKPVLLWAPLDDEYYVENCKKVANTREYTTNKLVELGFECTPSKANFIFAKSDKIGGEALYLKLKERGILVRHFSSPKICEYNRITIGTKEQMQALVDAIADILKQGE